MRCMHDWRRGVRCRSGEDNEVAFRTPSGAGVEVRACPSQRDPAVLRSNATARVPMRLPGPMCWVHRLLACLVRRLGMRTASHCGGQLLCTRAVGEVGARLACTGHFTRGNAHE